MLELIKNYEAQLMDLNPNFFIPKIVEIKELSVCSVERVERLKNLLESKDEHIFD